MAFGGVRCRLAVVVLGILAAGCGGSRAAPDAATPARTPEAAPSAVRAEPAAPEAPRPAAAEAAPIGWADVPAADAPEAFMANRAALEKHRAGDLAASRAGFEKAVGLSPRYGLARFNLACARTRLGELEAAAADLEALAAEDLPLVAQRFADDPDLAALRAAPAGARVAARIEALRAAWAAAAREGVAAIAFRGRRAPEGWPRVGLLRAGVWVHAPRRFVPLVPPSTLPLSALVDLAAGQAIMIAGQGRFDGIPQIEGASVQTAPLAPVGTELTTARGAGQAFDVEAGTRSGTVRYRLNTEGRTPRWSTTSLRASEPPDREWLTVQPEGTLLHTEPPAGWSLRGNELAMPDGTTIALGQGHTVSQAHQLLVSADGQTAIVVSVRADCPGGEGRLAHFVDRVAVGARSVERLSTGASTAAARLGGDGALYLQIGTATRRYATPAASTHEPLPEGILLVAPLDTPDCSA